MGASLVYLEQPKTDIEFEGGHNSKLRYCAGEMQGWRLNMEDAHILAPEFTQTQSLFGVFDGHGG